MKFETPSAAAPENVPGLGERLAHDYLLNRKIGSKETRAALARVVERAKNEYTMYGKVSGPIPELDDIVTFVTTQMAKLPNDAKPMDVYQQVSDHVTEYIRRQSKQKPGLKKAA